MSDEVLENIKRFARDAAHHMEDAMDIDDQDSDAVESRLIATINELQQLLSREQSELNQLKASSPSLAPTEPSDDPRERLKQLRVIRTAYERMTPETPYLPDPKSALQPLLAARVVQKTISDEKANISSARSLLQTLEQDILEEENQLSEAETLAAALHARTTELQQVQRDNLAKTTTEKTKELMTAKNQRKQSFERETQKLRKFLDNFIDKHLAAMLALEDIGGPVVGDVMSVDEDMLAAGFSAQGKLKAKSLSDSNRQRRIDEIWGSTASGDRQHESEKDAAAEEFRNLLNSLINSRGYVTLSRDSATARFLVRAKVAEFDPKDAKRLRLIDFSRTLDD
ncbi:uncharacterized protein PV09_05966 [Verruconis gallopava]|uniref:Uncharacterized protein n=1 Tax=Verruconis gallopava TaxID=253628 RepID=A0A0D2A8M5_9PEZI|nr:uncharacterized protein PV09_05966 [Verruconis gallopava]KIW02920.1 hypothetical protein PV09_05966 [Verruconis gallopava]